VGEDATRIEERQGIRLSHLISLILTCAISVTFAFGELAATLLGLAIMTGVSGSLASSAPAAGVAIVLVGTAAIVTSLALFTRRLWLDIVSTLGRADRVTAAFGYTVTLAIMLACVAWSVTQPVPQAPLPPCR